MEVQKIFHKAPQVIPDRIPAQMVKVNMDGFSAPLSLPKALNELYSLLANGINDTDALLDWAEEN